MEDNFQLYQNILDQLNISEDLHEKCTETFGKLDLSLQTLIKRIESKRIDKNCYNFKNTVERILSKTEFCKCPDNLKEQIRLKIEKLNLFNKEHELELREEELRAQPGRRHIPLEKDSGIGSATSKTLTDSKLQQPLSVSYETAVHPPSPDQDTAFSVVLPSCSSQPIVCDKGHEPQSEPIFTSSCSQDHSASTTKEASEHDEDLESTNL